MSAAQVERQLPYRFWVTFCHRMLAILKQVCNCRNREWAGREIWGKGERSKTGENGRRGERREGIPLPYQLWECGTAHAGTLQRTLKCVKLITDVSWQRQIMAWLLWTWTVKNRVPLSHWKKSRTFPGLSRTPWLIFQDFFGAHKCLNIKKKHLLLTTFATVEIGNGTGMKYGERVRGRRQERMGEEGSGVSVHCRNCSMKQNVESQRRQN